MKYLHDLRVISKYICTITGYPLYSNIFQIYSTLNDFEFTSPLKGVMGFLLSKRVTTASQVARLPISSLGPFG